MVLLNDKVDTYWTETDFITVFTLLTLGIISKEGIKPFLRLRMLERILTERGLD